MKRLGIMQPYFFPYIGYFSLIKHTDAFILFDPVQFIRHGWIERNRILKQPEGWLYIKAPLKKHERDTLIKDIQIDDNQDWRNKLMAQLQPYKKIAPYYQQVRDLVDGAVAQNASDIVTLNKLTLQAVCDYLGIKTPLLVFSDMNLTIDNPTAPDEWALNICTNMEGVDEYWNPPGGQAFFDAAKYQAAGISLKFQKPNLQEYDQKRSLFEAGLSIIDVLMFNDIETVQGMLDDYELI